MDKNKHLSVFREIRNGVFDFKQKLTSHFNQDFTQEDLSGYDLVGTLIITEDLTDKEVIEKLKNSNFLNTNVINNTPLQNSFLDDGTTKVRYKYEGPKIQRIGTSVPLCYKDIKILFSEEKILI